MSFDSEFIFENNVIEVLQQHGWEKEVLESPTEEELIENWRNILFMNNRELDKLNNVPLTDGEMRQIIEQIEMLRTPAKLNGFINGKSVSIKRDNPNDQLHFGKEVSLDIYDRNEIAAGTSKYQIARQPILKTSGIYNDRRADIVLLINGMPLFLIELKKTGVPVSQATYQIEKYSKEGAFRGIYSLIQIFVAMTPNETLYFANPGQNNKFNPDYYFHWADIFNEKINYWKEVVVKLLSIPMAHELIGFYTVADNHDGVLKVLRSYQYYAAHQISDKVFKTKWNADNNRGGYIWHTTGSGKTLTSFKSAQLIANAKYADKVIFLVDRIELGTQSLAEYRNFAEVTQDVQATESTRVLVYKLKSSDTANTLIVTSIQKFSRISEEDEGLKSRDLQLMRDKRIVIIVDEAHRSTFGEMLITIKNTFPRALFFGFTGTPIHPENQKIDNTTADIFGDELHRYTMADGFNDGNVLGFDPRGISTFDENDIRKSVALYKANAESIEEALNDDEKSRIFYKYMEEKDMVKIESNLSSIQYDNKTHRKSVVKNIIDDFRILSRNRKFHSIFATSSIKEAIAYYRLFKKINSELRVVGLFDPSIDDSGDVDYKLDALVELVTDYNKTYDQHFTLGSWAQYKKDVAARLAHKEPYINIERFPERTIDILIVVDQMLTGYDSKWLNTLYLDKILRYEHIIQAFSRTNRVFGPDKPYGVIKFYRKPNTMKKYIEEAVELYSGNKPLTLFVSKLEENINRINYYYNEIKLLFSDVDIVDFSKLPESKISQLKFAKLFGTLNRLLEAAYIQGFSWEKHGDKEVAFNQNDYLTLVLRYKELPKIDSSSDSEVYFDIDGYITDINTDLIDSKYMNEKFIKYINAINSGSPKDKEITLKELHSTFATLSKEEQKYAQLFLRDIERGEVIIEKDKSFRDYITEYMAKAKNDQISMCALIFGLNEDKLRQLMRINLTLDTINEFGQFDELLETIDIQKAKRYFELLESIKLNIPKTHIKINSFIRQFILENGFEITIPEDF